MTMHCRPEAQAEQRDAVARGRSVIAPTLPSMPRIAEAAGDADRVDVAELRARRPSGVLQSSEGTQSMSTLASLAKPPARSASVTDR